MVRNARRLLLRFLCAEDERENWNRKSAAKQQRKYVMPTRLPTPSHTASRKQTFSSTIFKKQFGQHPLLGSRGSAAPPCPEVNGERLNSELQKRRHFEFFRWFPFGPPVFFPLSREGLCSVFFNTCFVHKFDAEVARLASSSVDSQ